MRFETPTARTLPGFALAILVLAGCGTETALVPVEGTVTLDGVPVEGARVLFRPSQGRPAAGETDALGHYQLRYTPERLGTIPGRHVVQITTVREADDDAGRGAVRERLPARYNTKSTLEATVTVDQPKHDFALESK